MDNEKLLTIAIPTYNGAKTIANMLEILLPQCDERVEVLISDNASTDNTKLIIDKYIEKWKHPIILKEPKKLPAFLTKHYKGILVIFLVLFIPMGYAQNHTKV